MRYMCALATLATTYKKCWQKQYDDFYDLITFDVFRRDMSRSWNVLIVTVINDFSCENCSFSIILKKCDHHKLTVRHGILSQTTTSEHLLYTFPCSSDLRNHIQQQCNQKELTKKIHFLFDHLYFWQAQMKCILCLMSKLTIYTNLFWLNLLLLFYEHSCLSLQWPFWKELITTFTRLILYFVVFHATSNFMVFQLFSLHRCWFYF